MLMEAESAIAEQQFKIRSYNSPSAMQTEQQILNMQVRPRRNLLRLQFIKKRKDFAQAVKFTETDSDKNAQFQAFKDDLLGLKENKVMEIGLQGSEPYAHTGTQTFFKKKINKCLQITEVCQESDLRVKDDDLMRFLDNVYPEMEGALQSNQTIDIFQDDFNVLPAAQAGSKENAEISNTIKETKNLFYLKSRGKKISCIQFQPWLQGRKNAPIIASSFVQNLTFDDRVIFTMKSSKSHILFWNYLDMHAIDPLLILESPLQITTFEFNPKDPNIVVAGSVNGQILLWDLQNVQLSQLAKKKGKKAEKNQIREIPPTLMSALQQPSSIAPINDQIKRNIPSHKSTVMCLKWFPSGLQLEMKKSYVPVGQSSGEMTQFASISADGQVLLWDKKFVDAHKKQVTDLTTVVWKAGFGFHLFRQEGGGLMGGSHLVFNKNQRKPVFTGTSDQGELFVCDWSARAADEAGKYWSDERCFRPVVSLDLLPSDERVVLTVYDFHFCVWRTDVQMPIFTSAVTKSCFHTCGCWSLSRAGVLFIAKSNGTIDIWDFMEQSHKWTMQYSVGSIAISSLRFHDSAHNVLAVGNQEGMLHILELPFTLVRKIGDEDHTMAEYWQREIDSVKYFQKRFHRRFEESQEQRAEADLQEKLRTMKEEKKEKKEDQILSVNHQYQEFSTAYLNQFIYKLPPKEDEKKNKK